jgi:predicted GIY-YIG superfamily endonuclease
MSRPQTIKLFLTDGTPTGVWNATIMGRTIRATVVQRNNLESLGDKYETQGAVIYILAGTTPNNPLRQTIYIGQTESLLKRLGEHDRDEEKDFWQRTVIFSSADENLTRSHILYLESKLISMARDSGRSIITNGNTPILPSLPESDKALMDDWLDWIQLLLPVLGYNFSVPVPSVHSEDVKNEQDTNASESLKLTMDKVGVEAKLHEINGEWIIIAGSTMRKETRDSLPESLSKLRSSLLEEGIVGEYKENKDYWEFRRNYPATNLSMAASLIAGATYSGTGASPCLSS